MLSSESFFFFFFFFFFHYRPSEPFPTYKRGVRQHLLRGHGQEHASRAGATSSSPAFDAGFVTVDKPQLGFWIQAASAKVFGFHGWSIMLPQALAGVLSCRSWSITSCAGQWAPLAGLACRAHTGATPVSVAISRHNNLEGLLVLPLLLATWVFVLAAESGRLRWLLLGGVRGWPRLQHQDDAGVPGAARVLSPLSGGRPRQLAAADSPPRARHGS